jgi:hypothetical protein
MSTALRITGWRTGLKKIQMTKLLRTYVPSSLAEAKSVTDRVLSGEAVTLTLRDNATARELAHELELIGAIIEDLDRL